VHQLESGKAWRISHVDASRHLCGQHGFGLVMGAVSRDLRCLYHGDFLSDTHVTVNVDLSAAKVTYLAAKVTYLAAKVTYKFFKPYK